MGKVYFMACSKVWVTSGKLNYSARSKANLVIVCSPQLCFVLGAATRQLALSKLGISAGSLSDGASTSGGGSSSSSSSSGSSSTSGGVASGDPASLQAEAIALLRQAAGVFQFAGDKVLVGLPPEEQSRWALCCASVMAGRWVDVPSFVQC